MSSTLKTMAQSSEAEKSQPWRAFWPAPDSAARTHCERKSGTGGGGGGRNGQTAFNENGKLVRS
jgi:hypothetical protein